MSKKYDEVLRRLKAVEKRLDGVHFYGVSVSIKDPPKPESKKCYLCEKPPITHIKFKDGKSIVSCVDHDVLRQFPLADLTDPIPPDKLKPKRICDKCGGKFGDTCYHGGISKPAPAPPLHVRVAKALGHRVGQNIEGDWRTNQAYPLIPRYDKSVALAEQTANTYFNEHNRKWGICHLYPPDDYYQAFYFVDFEKDRSNFVCGDTAAEALSRLIIYHNERIR